MKRIGFLLLAAAILAGVVASRARVSEQDNREAAPIFGIKIYPGYRDWRLISVAHEEGSLNDLRAILGNNVAMAAYRSGKLPYPDGTVIARLAWSYVPSEENDKVFGRPQSFVPGPQPDWYLQFMVKDSKRYAATVDGGSPNSIRTANPPTRRNTKPVSPCHEPIKERDFVFTHYAP